MGIVSRDSNDLVSVKLDSNEKFLIGYIKRRGTELSEIGKDFLELLRSYI